MRAWLAFFPVMAATILAAAGLELGRSQEVLAQEPEAGDFAYHETPPTRPLPKTRRPPSFRRNPPGHVAYCLARRIPGLLYQEPCFCHCNRFANHKSLLDCYVEDHGMACYTCQAEVIFCYEQSLRGRNAVEIREELYQDEWKKLSLEDYVHSFPKQKCRAAGKRE